VVVNNLNIESVIVSPDKTDPPLIIDTNTMLTLAISVERLQPVSRRSYEVPQFRRTVDLAEFSPRDKLHGGESLATNAMVKPLRLLTAKRLDHTRILYRLTFNVKQWYTPNG